MTPPIGFGGNLALADWREIVVQALRLEREITVQALRLKREIVVQTLRLEREIVVQALRLERFKCNNISKYGTREQYSNKNSGLFNTNSLTCDP